MKYLLEVLVTVGFSQLLHEITLMCSLNVNSVCVLRYSRERINWFYFLTFLSCHRFNPRLHTGEGTSGTRSIQESTGDRRNFKIDVPKLC